MSDPSAPTQRSVRSLRLLTSACVMALIGVGVSLLHLVWPTALFFALFMIVGQGSFALALLLYAIAIFSDLKRQKVL
jgi:hypothetical protein